MAKDNSESPDPQWADRLQPDQQPEAVEEEEAETLPQEPAPAET